MNKTNPKATSGTRTREEWRNAVTSLTEAVRDWAEARGWNVAESLREVSEETITSSTFPVLEIQTPRGQVMLEPIGRDILGAQGRVDLYAWPSLYRVLLLRKQDHSWVIRTESGLNWPHPWNQATFYELAEGLVDAV